MPTTLPTLTAAPVPRPATWRADAWTLPEVRWALTATALFAGGLLAALVGAPPWLSWTLFLASYGTGGWEPAVDGLRALRQGTLDVDLLMVVAAVGAASIGHVLDGALLIVIFATSGALEAVATNRTEHAVRSLLDVAPATAVRISPSGREETIEASELTTGDVLLVRPGTRIGGDGVVIDGVSEVDQASITGEPLPVAKRRGDDIFAGTVNGTGSLRIRVLRPAAETVIARIAAMVAEATASKAHAQLFIEKVEQRYSIGMVAATLALFVVPLLFGAELEPTLLRAMTFMIVASPCALVLSTMPPLLSAIANAGRHGVLIKSAVALEKLGTVTRVAFDKTGTLTEGKPRLAVLRTMSSWSMADVLRLAAAAEYHSEHPLGRAIVAAAVDVGLEPMAAANFDSIPGRGVRARVGEHTVEVSRPDPGCHDPAVLAVVAELESAGHTVVAVIADGIPVGVLGLSDRVRADSHDAVSELADLTGTQPSLLTGDNPRAAAHVASRVGIGDVHAGLRPADKVGLVRAWESEGSKVMLVGDGVNDAPAMAMATVGIAMGRTGSDLALDTADAVIARDDLSTLPALLALARRARRVVIANLTIAATFIIVLVTWDLFGELPLPLGVAGHEGSTILVALNGVRLLSDRAWPSVRPATGAVRPPRRRGSRRSD